MKKNSIKIFSAEELRTRNDGLVIIKEAFEELGIDFFLMMGILLGAVREKNFIKWDWDVELGIYVDSIINRVGEVQNVFKKYNFKILIVDQSYEGFKINLFYKENKYTLWGLHFDSKWLKRKTYRFPKKYFTDLAEIVFHDKVYKIPNNPEELLTYIYGDWETPIVSNEKKSYLNRRVFNKGKIINRIINRIIN
tara:strand:- start:253 stop:834 length:582 start_codon:yes stop_codon:yes gene_type:complete